MIHLTLGDATVDLIIFVFVAIFWGISVLLGALKKASQPKPAIPAQPTAQPVAPPPVRRVVTPPVRKVAGPAPNLPAGRQTKPAPPPRGPAVAKTATAQVAPPTRSISHAPASPFGRLIRPETIRAQYVLSEVLGKPVALRDERRAASAPPANHVREGRSG